MKYCGIILAKNDSKRLPHKNFLEINGKKMFEYAYEAISEVIGEENVFFSTDHEYYKNRPPAASLPDEPLFQVIKWAYKCMPKRYDAIINIMANCPEITAKDVKRAIRAFEKLNVKELRSFNLDGSESGLIIVKEDYLLQKHEISTYQGAIMIKSNEIHTKKDLELCHIS
jgi:CMP-N-acetylneuraminic acid synthetase